MLKFLFLLLNEQWLSNFKRFQSKRDSGGIGIQQKNCDERESERKNESLTRWPVGVAIFRGGLGRTCWWGRRWESLVGRRKQSVLSNLLLLLLLLLLDESGGVPRRTEARVMRRRGWRWRWWKTIVQGRILVLVHRMLRQLNNIERGIVIVRIAEDEIQMRSKPR